MEKIDEQLNNLSFFLEIPVGVHQSVMQKIHYQKIKIVFFVIFALLSCNFLILAWHINAKLIDAEFIDMVQDFFDVFNLSFSFIGTIFTSFFEIISPALFLSALLSLVGVIYTGKQISFYKFS